MLLAVDRPGPRRRVSPFGCSAVLHLLLLAPMWLPYPEFSTNQAEATPITVIAVAPSAIAPTADGGGDEGAPSTPEDLGIDLPPGVTSVTVEGFTFDFATVVSRAASLFPFLDPPLLEDRADRTRERRDATLSNPLVRAAEPGHAPPPLALTDAAVQALADEAWSRRDRWRAFQPIAELTGRYHPDAGRLPDVLRAYVDQNLLQPFVDSSTRDPRLWAQLAVAADHRAFVDFILAFASRHPSTRGRTELLFLLDKLAQSNLHALATLIETNPHVELARTRAASADAFRAIVEMRRHYVQELDRRELAAPGALSAHYDGLRFTILHEILRTTPDGYREDDARYLIGTVQWGQGDHDGAIATWREMEGDSAGIYHRTYSAILAAISVAGGSPVTPAAIDAILARERGEWVASSIDRLHRFGYRVDRF